MAHCFTSEAIREGKDREWSLRKASECTVLHTTRKMKRKGKDVTNQK